MKNNILDNLMKEESKNTHPTELVKKTFQKRVMDIITSDHHKTKDGGFVISYDLWEDKWHISHYGYIREVEVEGETFLEAAGKYLLKIERENDKVLWRETEEYINQKLPDDYSAEISDDSVVLSKYEKGEDNWITLASMNCKNMNKDKIAKKVKDLITGHKKNDK